MKLKTIKTFKEYEWHKHFLWIPKKVRICEDKEETHGYLIGEIEFRYEILWLETVERKNVSGVSLSTDDGKYIYWKSL